jgi:hypothetical protein
MPKYGIGADGWMHDMATAKAAVAMPKKKKKSKKMMKKQEKC